MRKKEQAVLFEGYVDTIAAWRAGVENGVATLGTSLTEEQAKLLKRNVPSVVICYDSDNAGVEAAFRASAILQKAGVNVRIAQMPDGLDPDDYIQKFGTEKFNRDVIGASLTVMAFKIRYFRRGKILTMKENACSTSKRLLRKSAGCPMLLKKTIIYGSFPMNSTFLWRHLNSSSTLLQSSRSEKG